MCCARYSRSTVCLTCSTRRSWPRRVRATGCSTWAPAAGSTAFSLHAPEQTCLSSTLTLSRACHPGQRSSQRSGDRLEPQAMIRVCSVSGDPWRRLCWRDEQIPYSVWARRGIFRLRALEWFRGGASTGRSLHDLERLQARGADVGALRRGTFLDTDFLQVWVPAPAGCAQRVTARVAEVWTLSAGITDFSHDKSPVLRYRPMRGEGPEETVKRTPKSGLRAEIVPDPCGT